MLPTLLTLAPTALGLIAFAAFVIVFKLGRVHADLLITLGLAASIIGLVTAIAQAQVIQAYVLGAGVAIGLIFVAALIFVALLPDQELPASTNEQPRREPLDALSSTLAHD